MRWGEIDDPLQLLESANQELIDKELFIAIFHPGVHRIECKKLKHNEIRSKKIMVLFKDRRRAESIY